MSTIPRALILVLLLLAVSCSSRPPADGPRVRVVSSPPQMVSGGEARIEVEAPNSTNPNDVLIHVDGVEVEVPLVERDGVLDGVLKGLPAGAVEVAVTVGDERTTLDLINHPVTGPIFSGPPQEPFFCATDDHRRRVRLGEILDENCSVETRVDFLYVSDETGEYKDYDPSEPAPDDLATTTTLEGDSVDFIVRWERGTINRFIYSLAVLSPNNQLVEDPDLSGWNRRLIFQFEGGVGIGHYQGAPGSRMLEKQALAHGYALAYSTGTRTGVHYDLEVGGETAIMVKDRFVTEYGKPLYTVGIGGSGGGIQQYIYAQNHPGLLDAGIPQYSYPDMVTQTIHVGDCELLERYMDAEVARDPNSPWSRWTNRTWLEGMAASDTLPNPYNGGRPGLTECINGWRGLSPLTLNPHYGTAPGISPEQQASIHWTHSEDLVQIYDRAADGYAARAWDNVGVQYGLQALRDGKITPAVFLDLNARIGSWKNEPEMVQEGRPFIEEGDPDPHSARNMRLSPSDSGDPPAPRAQADPGAIEGLYEHGMVFTGDIDLPMIDWRHYLEPFLDMHNSHQSFASRQRMLDHDGEADNHVIWFTDAESMDGRFDQTPMALQVIDQWMSNIRRYPDRTIADNKPDRAVDSCFDSDGELIFGGDDAWDGILNDRSEGPCTRRFRLYSTSRIVAGGPISGDVFKCALQPVDRAVAAGVYGTWQPSEEQLERLRAIFPDGVCDYETPPLRRPSS